ncbi:GIY-YIG nuclease family protein [Chitinophaga sp. ARDCPP14]|uniref:GIY-YIG nuclease family protein n=1 Tax=Chitinophaga sp. ARDCPP14 TaxID=3391139 RepID=UPI003F52728F
MDKDKKKLLEIFNNDPLGLLNIKPSGSSIMPEEERLINSFLEINSFFEKYGREPQQGNGVQEHQLFTRLKSIRENSAKKQILLNYDRFELLKFEQRNVTSLADILEDDVLGLLADDTADSLHELKNIPKVTTMPEYIGRRIQCVDFEQFSDLFIECQAELKKGIRKLYPFKNEQQIEKGRFYVLKGILLYIAEIGRRELENGKTNARLRCVFENGTESDMLLRSLAAELYKDGRRVTLKDDELLEALTPITVDDLETGYIYILKSKSENPEIKSIHDLYKIGFSKIEVEDRIKNAALEPTYLMAEVSIVMTVKCYNLNPQKLELLLHNFFGRACLNIDVFDRAGNRYTPREWFIAPLEIIEKAIDLIISGEIVGYMYDLANNEIKIR